MWITRTSIKNPVFATMVMIGITVLGVFSYARLRVEQMPDVSLPFVHDHDDLSGCRAGGRRGRRHQADRVRGQPGLRRQAHPLELARRLEPGVHRVPAVDQRRQRRSRTCATRSRWCGPSFPRDVKDPLVNRVDNENNQPVVSLAVHVADDRPARAHVAHRPDDRQGAGEPAGRRAHRRQRPRDARRS